MLITWSPQARADLEELLPAVRETVKSEVSGLFGDAVPALATALAEPAGALGVQFSCGVEAGFERIGDGIRLLFLR